MEADSSKEADIKDSMTPIEAKDRGSTETCGNRSHRFLAVPPLVHAAHMSPQFKTCALTAQM